MLKTQYSFAIADVYRFQRYILDHIYNKIAFTRKCFCQACVLCCNVYINANREESQEELEWLKIINTKYTPEFNNLGSIYLVTNKLNAVASRKLLEIVLVC